MGTNIKNLKKPNLCPVCNGEGRTTRKTICKTCKGRGILIPKPPNVAKKR